MINENECILNSREAYSAMFKFLEKYYEETHSEEIGGLLGSMAISSDGFPMDSGYWNEWLSIVKKVKSADSSQAK